MALVVRILLVEALVVHNLLVKAWAIRILVKA